MDFSREKFLGTLKRRGCITLKNSELENGSCKGEKVGNRLRREPLQKKTQNNRASTSSGDLENEKGVQRAGI